MKKTIFLQLLVLCGLGQVFSQTLTDTQMRNARATGYAIVAARNPGVSFSIMVIPWDGINTLEYNANTQINTGWHPQAAVKGNYFTQTFNGSDFSGYSSVVVSEADFNTYKSTGTQWWIVCSTLPSFSNATEIKYGVDGYTATLSGAKFSGAIEMKAHSGAGGYTNRYLRLGMKDNNAVFYPVISVNEDFNVGIGVVNPDYKLHIKDGTGGAQLKFQRGTGIATIVQDNDVNNLYIDAPSGLYLNTQGGGKIAMGIGGDVGIGTPTPWNKLHIIGPTGDANTGIVRLDGVNANASLRIGINTNYAWIQSHNSKPLYINDLANDTFINSQGGSVAIGTHTPDVNAKLTVKGLIHTNEVLVDMNIQGPDYVFEKDYDLLSLSEVEAYINQNKHLPEVPSAKEMEADGLNLKEMNLLLLKKVEELTLHLIEKEKKIASIEKRLQEIENR